MPPALRLAAASLLALAACTSSRQSSMTEAPPRTADARRLHPLAALFGADRVIVLPTRFLAVDQSLGWTTALDSATTLAAVDDEIRFAMGERGVGGAWAWADEVRRSAARSAGMVPDVRKLNAEPLLGVRAGEAITVPDPLRSHLRALGALHGARYALYPLLLSISSTTTADRGPGRATLRLALIDVRTATVEWTGEVASEPSAAFGPALTAGVASKVGDLVLTRP